MSWVSAPLKKRLRRYEPDDAGAQETALLPSEEGSAFFVDDDEDLGDLAKTFDLALRAHMLDESAKWAKKAKKLENADNAATSDVLTSSEATMYRALSARCNYLSQDRPDIPYSSKD